MRRNQLYVKKELRPVIADNVKKQRVLSARLSRPKYTTKKYEYSQF